MPDLNWDDVRFVLALARAGNVVGAALRLGVDPSTVLRRVRAVENLLRTKLFLGAGATRRLSAAGQEFLPAAEQVEQDMARLQLRLAGRAAAEGGVVRVATPDALAMTLVPELVARFHDAHPDIRVEVITTNVPVDLAVREAEIELRPTMQPHLALRGRRLSRIAFGAYVAQPALRPGLALAEYNWILHDPVAMPIYAPARWVREDIAPRIMVASAGSAVVMAALVASGLGVAALPCYLADRRDDLRCLAMLDAAEWGELWLLTHPSLRHAASVRLLVAHLTRTLHARRPILEGQGIKLAG